MNYFYNSEYFKLKEIEIEGYQHYSQEELRSYLNEFKGKNIFEIDKKMVEQVLFQNCSWIKEVDFSKVFPDKMKVLVVERKPFILTKYRSNFFLLDSEGIVLEHFQNEKPEQHDNLILVTNALDFKPEIGDKVAKKNALSCGDIFMSMDNELKSIFRQAQLGDNFGEIVFITTEDKRIVFGSSDDTAQKLSILKELLKDDVNYNIIDLTNFENPVIN
ncbi:MAG: FtsQ-type POTRA domain-containing protein [Actinomycetia bacterium]|nr:FtsQ-type POTRA domain-containing protein [Actinomycetes bacterium]